MNDLVKKKSTNLEEEKDLIKQGKFDMEEFIKLGIARKDHVFLDEDLCNLW